MSYRYKIALSFFLTASLVMVVVLWQSLNFIEKRLAQQIQLANQTLIELIKQHSAVGAIITEDYSSIQFELKKLVDVSNMDDAVLLDANETILASTNTRWLGQSFSSVRTSADWRLDDVRGSSGVIGKLGYKFNSHYFQQARVETLRFGGTLLFSGLVIIALAGGLIGSLLARRVATITKGLDKITAGNLEEFTVDESKDEVGELSRFVWGMGKKISAQMSELLDVEERTRVSLQAAGAGTWKWDVANSSLYWSAKNFQLLGYMPAKHEPSYQLWRSSLHPDDLPKADAAVKEMWATRSGLDVEYRVIRRNGEVRWMRNVARMFLNQDGEPVEIYGLQFDITHYQARAADLESNNLLLEALVNQCEDCSIVVDVNHQISLVTASTLSKFGYSYAELYGQPIALLFDSQSKPVVEDFIANCLDPNKNFPDQLLRELHALHKQGHAIPVRVRIAKHLDQQLRSQFLLTLRELS